MQTHKSYGPIAAGRRSATIQSFSGCGKKATVDWYCVQPMATGDVIALKTRLSEWADGKLGPVLAPQYFNVGPMGGGIGPFEPSLAGEVESIVAAFLE